MIEQETDAQYQQWSLQQSFVQHLIGMANANAGGSTYLTGLIQLEDGDTQLTFSYLPPIRITADGKIATSYCMMVTVHLDGEIDDVIEGNTSGSVGLWQTHSKRGSQNTS